MSMRKRDREPQGVLFVAASDLSQGGGHPFYERLNRVLDQCGFDDYVERFCQPYYAEKRGPPSIPPGVYFRMLIHTQRSVLTRAGMVISRLAIPAFLILTMTSR